jgi:hypothetical protein
MSNDPWPDPTAAAKPPAGRTISEGGANGNAARTPAGRSRVTAGGLDRPPAASKDLALTQATAYGLRVTPEARFQGDADRLGPRP